MWQRLVDIPQGSPSSNILTMTNLSNGTTIHEIARMEFTDVEGKQVTFVARCENSILELWRHVDGSWFRCPSKLTRTSNVITDDERSFVIPQKYTTKLTTFMTTVDRAEASRLRHYEQRRCVHPIRSKKLLETTNTTYLRNGQSSGGEVIRPGTYRTEKARQRSQAETWGCKSGTCGTSQTTPVTPFPWQVGSLEQ